MKKILVTGGTGYIGSHTVVELQNNGYEVVIADNLSNSYASVVDQIEKITSIRPIFEKVELTDLKETQQLFQKHKGIAGVIHFAALKAVGESSLYPLKYYQNNLTSLFHLLHVMQQENVDYLVFSSSCTVYGQPERLPVSETSPVVKAVSVYGNTKQICEEIILDHSKTSSLKSIILRYFNPIGAHPTALIGELPIGVPNNLVPFITQTAIGKRKMLHVFGNDYNTPDGTCIRDYIHVVDLANAHVAALKHLIDNSTNPPTDVFNLGTGTGYSVLQVIDAFEKATQQNLPYQIEARREGDAEQIWANPEKAEKILKWRAEKSMDEMMRSAWEWEKYLQKKN